MVTRSPDSVSIKPTVDATATPTPTSADVAIDVASADMTDSSILVTLLLEGGHEYQLSLAQDAPTLRKLFAMLLEPLEKRRTRLFQFPIATDTSSPTTDQAPALCFTGDRLVGLITDPPIYIQQPVASDVPQSDSHLQKTTAKPTSSNSPPTSTDSHYTVVVLPEREQSLPKGVIPSRYIQLTNFLDPATYQRLLEFTLSQQNAFVGSSTSTGDLDYRKSSVLHHFPEFSNLMQGEIHAAFADVIAALKLTPFNITQVEAQLTAHNDGNYYKVHNDNGSEDTATRVLTYVYYFYQEPKPFSGGALRIYDSRIENNYYVQAESFQDVVPINNSIVFFPSHYMHEVLPIICPSREFGHSRFTINGWVRR